MLNSHIVNYPFSFIKLVYLHVDSSIVQTLLDIIVYHISLVD